MRNNSIVLSQIIPQGIVYIGFKKSFIFAHLLACGALKLSFLELA